MALPSGLAGSIGVKTQTTAAVPITVDRWIPLISEQIDNKTDRVMSQAILSGRVLPASQQWAAGNIAIGGPVNIELDDRSVGVLFTWIYGAVSSSGGPPYTHTFTPGDLSDDFFTLQVGRPDVNGTVNPFTYDTCMIESWTLTAEVNKTVTLTFNVVGRSEIRYRSVSDGVTTSTSPNISSATAAFVADDVGKPISSGTTAIPAASYIGSVTSATAATLSSSPTTNTPVNSTASTTANTFTIGVPLAAVSYAASIRPMIFLGSSVTIAGTAQNVKKLVLTGTNGLDANRRFLGSAYIAQPKAAALRDWGGSLDMEYEGVGNYKRYTDGTEAALVSTFAAGAQILTVTDNVRFDGNTPNVAGPGILQLSQPFKVIGTTTDALGSTATFVTTEVTP